MVQLARAFQVRGHLLANLDPLGILPPRPENEDLDMRTYGFSEADLNKPVDLSGLAADVKGFIDRGRGRVTLGEIYTRLRETYCGTIGYEYMHIPSIEKCNWIREKIETREKMVFTREAKLQILDRLTWADHFERFIQKKHGSAKRFGLEGAESFIAGMKSLIGRSAELSVDNIVIGMPHRGRLNVLNTVVRKNTAQIFAEFADTQEDEPDSGHGDVKYHLGMSFDQKAGKDKQKTIHLTLISNPSHLEAVDPVVLGKTKAKQFYSGDKNGDHSMGLLLHGDAAFAGQGIVYETMGLMHLDGYSTGGTVHMVVNNQIGFTTDPVQGRSTPYCTDIAKAFNLPVFHVNGDDPEAVVHVCELAAEWRARYKTDVVIDLVCYRKYGHNEIDEPSFTQPLMYSKIQQMPSALVRQPYTHPHDAVQLTAPSCNHLGGVDGVRRVWCQAARAELLVRPACVDSTHCTSRVDETVYHIEREDVGRGSTLRPLYIIVSNNPAHLTAAATLTHVFVSATPLILSILYVRYAACNRSAIRRS